MYILLPSYVLPGSLHCKRKKTFSPPFHSRSRRIPSSCRECDEWRWPTGQVGWGERVSRARVAPVVGLAAYVLRARASELDKNKTGGARASRFRSPPPLGVLRFSPTSRPVPSHAALSVFLALETYAGRLAAVATASYSYSKVMEAGAPVHQITNQSGGFGPCRPSSSSWIAMCGFLHRIRSVPHRPHLLTAGPSPHGPIIHQSIRCATTHRHEHGRGDVAGWIVGCL